MISLISFVLVGCSATSSDAFPPTTTPDSTLEPARAFERSATVEAIGPTIGSDRVWDAPNTWDALDAAPGLAWSANSGLTWDEKYRAWIDGLEITQAVDGNVTAEIITPWGVSLPLNRLECAESAIVLRATFAAWYGLPFYLSGYSPALGENVYYGHFGMVRSNGTPVPWQPDFSTYTDATDAMDALDVADIPSQWVDDPALEGLALTLAQDDANEFLGVDQFTGAYLDEIHANKRVGHWLLRTLTDFGSIHLAHATNVFDLEADAIEPGDVLIHRWQAQGVGHTMVVKERIDSPDQSADINVLAGNMPRVQPRWLFDAVSKTYFTHRYSGGADIDPNTGEAYVTFGGGLKRWRTPIEQGGRWVNIVPLDDRGDYISTNDPTALSARLDDFEILLGEQNPEDARDALLVAIEASRDALEGHPSSCANRERRENAFEDLYALMEAEFGMTRAEVDWEYRTLADYVFAELDYTASPSCCWNSSTDTMYDLVIAYAEAEQDDAEAANTCVEPTIFRMRDGGYAPFSDYAASVGQADAWVDWSADEACPQADATDGIVSREPFTAWCDLEAPADPDPVDPDPTDTGDTGVDNGDTEGGCGCSSNSSALWGFGLAAVGMVLQRRRED